jgi:exodeoxyribonuclease V beta subunit
MKRFDIVAKETELLGRKFLQASAGTGKTFTIEHLVVRLIIEHGLNLDQILVVTFTKAATRELKMRIRAQLESKKLHHELLSFDQAQIFTIHGFCHRMLQEFAFDAGIGFNLDEWEKSDEKLAVADFLRSKIDESRFSAAQIGYVMKKFRHDVQKLTTALLKEKKAPLKEPDFEEKRQLFNEKIKTIPPFSMAQEYERVSSYFKEMKDEFSSQAEFLDGILQKREAMPADFDQILRHKPHFLKMLDASNRKVRAPAFSLHPGLVQLQAEVLPIIEGGSSDTKILKRLAQEWEQEREKISREKERVSPDEILAQMQKCLKLPQFVDKVWSKYKAVIVDEFQDTDPVQWEIFETLFLHDGLAAFYLVGDPKQSIYAFRSADIYTYMNAGKKLGEDAWLHLDTNYRSTSGLIDALNRLFCRTDWIDLPLWNTSLPVHPVKAAKSGEGSLRFFIAEGHLGRGKTWPSVELEEKYFLPFIAQEISHPQETAVLVKDRFQARRVRRYLQKWNIPSSLARGSSLAESEALSAFKELVEAVFNPQGVKKALLGALIGMGVADLTDGTLLQAAETFAELRTVLIEKGVEAFFAAFLKSEWKGRTVLDRLVSQKDLTLYHDLNAIAERAIAEKDPERVIRCLDEMKEMETDDRVSGEGSGVQIMTIYASKGLEFDTVFALGLASRTPESEEPAAALRELDAEKMRQLYVALTRAKTRLFIPIARDLDGKTIPIGTASPMELFLERTKPDLSQFSCTLVNDVQFDLKIRSSEKKELFPPLPSKRPLKPKLVDSFSAMSQKRLERVSPPKDILPAGTETGVIVHKIFEKALTGPVDIAGEVLGTHLQGWEAQLQEMIDKALQLPILDFPRDRMFQELEFVFPENGGLIKGFIDLFFEKEGKYYLADWKTNWLENYSQESLEQAMHEGDYFLQGSLYAQALKRYLQLYDPRPFEECFGGAYYIFVRGPAVYHFFPSLD